MRWGGRNQESLSLFTHFSRVELNWAESWSINMAKYFPVTRAIYILAKKSYYFKFVKTKHVFLPYRHNNWLSYNRIAIPSKLNTLLYKRFPFVPFKTKFSSGDLFSLFCLTDFSYNLSPDSRLRVLLTPLEMIILSTLVSPVLHLDEKYRISELRL